jgi:RNA recognition motif-containing protein
MNIYIANMPLTTDADAVRKAFETFGEVSKVNLIKDKNTQELRGFGFIEMPAQKEAQEAIDILNGSEIDGKKMVVSEAKPRKSVSNNGGGYSAGRSW